MRYIAIINTDIPLTEHDIQFIKNTIFCGNEQVPYVFEIEDIKCKGESEQSYTRKEIEKMLKDTYLEVSNMDLKTKHLGDAQTVACSKFRNIMVDKLSKTEKVVETPWYMQIFNQDILNEYQKRMRDATPEERQKEVPYDDNGSSIHSEVYKEEQGMTREEAKQVFLSRGYVEVEGGTIYDADKWRESCRVISEWLEQETRWIPVDYDRYPETYPKAFQEVWLTDGEGEVKHKAYDGTRNIKAWMPYIKPEPYKAESEE